MGEAKISFGAKVVVYKLSVDSEARIMPTIHLEVPEELIERAKTVREERGILSDQGRGLRTLSRRTDGTYVSQPVTKEGMNNGVKIYLILALLMLLFAAAPIIIAFIFMIVMHFRIVN